MEKRIVYKNDSNGISVIIPSLDSGLTIEQIALKDVPANTAYRIMDHKDLPPRESRDRWFWTEEGQLGVAEEVVATE